MNKQNKTHESLKPISVKIGGVAHHGHYQTAKLMIRVSYKGSTKATQLGQSPPETLARTILAELVRKAPDE